MSALAVVAHASPLAQAWHVFDTTSAAERALDDVRLDAYLHGGNDDLTVIDDARGPDL